MFRGCYSQKYDQCGFYIIHQSTYQCARSQTFAYAPILRKVIALYPGNETQKAQFLRLDLQCHLDILHYIIYT